MGTFREEARCKLCTSADGYITYCHTETGPFGNRDLSYFLLGKDGAEISASIFGGVDREPFTAIVPNRKGYAAVGLSTWPTFNEGQLRDALHGSQMDSLAIYLIGHCQLMMLQSRPDGARYFRIHLITKLKCQIPKSKKVARSSL